MKSAALRSTRKAQDFGEKPGRCCQAEGKVGQVVKSPQNLVSLMFLNKLLKGFFFFFFKNSCD